jgi:hypothetical protein
MVSTPRRAHLINPAVVFLGLSLVLPTTRAVAADPATSAEDRPPAEETWATPPGGLDPAAQEPPADAAADEAAAEAVPDVAAPDGDRADDDWEDLASDPCAVGKRGNWIEWIDQRLTRSVCSTARWFDNFFGSSRAEERDATFGRVGLGARWDEDDGFDDQLRFRAKFHLPNLEDRVNVFVGRGRTEALDEEEAPNDDAARDLFFSDESEWLLGFGVSQLRSADRRASLDIGVRFSSGLDPYSRVSLIQQWHLGARRFFRARLTPQWRRTRGFGATSSLSLERGIGRDFLLRHTITGQFFDQKFEGIAYTAGTVLYQHLGRGRAIRYGVSASGETDKDVPLQDVGFVITYRHSIYKEALFLEGFGGTRWRRRTLEDGREPKVILGLLVELKFGQ